MKSYPKSYFLRPDQKMVWNMRKIECFWTNDQLCTFRKAFCIVLVNHCLDVNMLASITLM